MSQRRFETPEQAVEYMKQVAVKRSGFSNWLQVEPLKVWEGESELLLELRPEMTQHHGFAHGAIAATRITVTNDTEATARNQRPCSISIDVLRCSTKRSASPAPSW